MKWFRNPFTDGATYKIQKAWWNIAAPSLMRDLKVMSQYSDRCYDDVADLTAKIEELEDKNAELNRKNMLNQNGYWHVVNDGNNHSCYRLDEKFIEWYKMWREPIQMKLEFEYERGSTKEEEKRYDPIYGGLIE
jgi:hypothetical protein